MNKMETLTMDILTHEQTLDAPKLAGILYPRNGEMSQVLFTAYLRISKGLLVRLHEAGVIAKQRDGWYTPKDPSDRNAPDFPDEVQLKPPESI